MASRLLAKIELETNRLLVLSTYRHLLRATRIAFDKDTTTLLASRSRARDSFNNSRSFEPGSTAAAQGIEHAQGVTKILRENVVQGRHKGDDTYKLNIHEHTQRLDNTTATQLKGTTKTFKELKTERF